MRRSSSSPSVALFPFLAVLVCAMGALILLLLVTTRKMRQVAVARAMAEEAAEHEQQVVTAPPAIPEPATEPEPAEKAPEPQGPQLFPAGPSAEELAQQQAEKEAEKKARQVAREARRRHNEEARKRQQEREQEWQKALADLERQRSEQREKVRQSTTLLSELKSRLEKTELSLQKLQERKQQFEARKEQDSSEREKIEKQHKELADAITAAQKEMAELRKAHADEQSKFAFIPYDGARGTTRRPIYIECTAAGIRFQPEGILLDESDLRGFTESENPLLAGIEAVMHHWQNEKLAPNDPRRLQRPYVLLIVRPSGTVAYGVARQMLRSLGDDFGYELIEDGFPLQIPASDDSSKNAINQAIAASMKKRGESLADGSRPSAARFGVTMDEPDDTIDFTSLDGQVAAAAAVRQSPFTEHSNKTGKNFSITRRPVRSDELVSSEFRSELERATNLKPGPDSIRNAPSFTGGNSPLRMGSGGRTGTAPRGTGGTASTGGAGGAGVSGGGVAEPRAAALAAAAQGMAPGDRLAVEGGDAQGAPQIVSGNNSSIEIKRGWGRNGGPGTGIGNDDGNGPSGSGTGTKDNSRIPQLPKLSDPFARDQVALNDPDVQPKSADDAALGFSGGVEQSSGAGANASGAKAGTGTGTGSRGPTGARTGTRSAGAGGTAVSGVRSATLLELPGGNPFESAEAGTDGTGAQVPGGVPGGTAKSGGTAADQAGGSSPGPGGAANSAGGGTPAGSGGGAPIPTSGGVVPVMQFGDAADSGSGTRGGNTTASGSDFQSASRPGTGTGRSSGTRGRTSTAAATRNAFDRTQGSVIEDEFTREAQSHLDENPGGTAMDLQAKSSRKSYGDNPSDTAMRRAKNRALTPSQKTELGRQRWGGNNVGQIGFEKKVAIQVMPDKFIIGKNEVEIAIEPDSTREELVDSILEGLDANSDSWGNPPKKFYWIPYLQFEVHKGGVVQYEQVHAPLRDWGLSSDVKFVDGATGERGLIQPEDVKAANSKSDVGKAALPQKPPIKAPAPARKKLFGR